MISITRRDTSVYGLWTERLGFDSGQGQEMFLFSIMFRRVLKLNLPPITWMSGALYPGIKQSRGEVDHSPPTSVEVKNGGTIHSLSHMSS
jgi:hypothetical protein